jgi:hypothetical protein
MFQDYAAIPKSSILKHPFNLQSAILQSAMKKTPSPGAPERGLQLPRGSA